MAVAFATATGGGHVANATTPALPTADREVAITRMAALNTATAILGGGPGYPLEPADVVALLNRHIVEVVALPEVRKRISDLGTEPRGSTPDELAALLRDDIKKWAAVLKQAKIEPR